MALSRIPPADLRWRVDPRRLVDDEASRMAHSGTLDRLISSLSQAMADNAPARGHIFVRGHAASDRGLLLKSGLKAIRPPEREHHDYCLVHNFVYPDRPRLLRLPAGSGRKLRARLGEISRFIRDQLESALEARPIRNRLQALADRSDAEMRRLTGPLEKKLKPHGLVLVREEVGQLVRLTVHVQQTGRVITQDDLANLVAKGQVSPEEFEQIRAVIRDSQPTLRKVSEAINATWNHAHQLRGRLLRAETRRLLADLAQPVLRQFKDPGVKAHIEAIIGDVLEKRVDTPTDHLADPELLYSVNLVHTTVDDGLNVVHEHAPTPRNLGGTIDPSWLENRRSVASFLGVRGGSLLTANGGFLVIDAEDLLEHPRSISLLRNALTNGKIGIEPPPNNASTPAISLRPAPIPIDARVILCGTERHWQLLQQDYPEFVGLFAAPIDIPDSIPRDAAGIGWIASRLRDAAERVHSAPISDEAIAALVEQAARMGGRNRLSTRMGDLLTVLRMAAALAGSSDDDHVSAVHVHKAIDRMRPSRPVSSNPRFETSGFPVRQHQLGQVHVCGLEPDGDRNYGQLIRIQASLAPAPNTRIALEGAIQAGPEISIRIESALAHSMRMDQAIGLHALISCGSTSSGKPPHAGGALMLGSVLALVSRLSDIPLRQDLAVIGSLDSDCRLTPLEGINARVEDCFQIAQQNQHAGSTGVIIPAMQREELMLRPELIQAVQNDLFGVYAAGNLSQVLEMLTGASPGHWRDGKFTADSMFERARKRLTGN